jgi:hypothetical protein
MYLRAVGGAGSGVVDCAAGSAEMLVSAEAPANLGVLSAFSESIGIMDTATIIVANNPVRNLIIVLPNPFALRSWFNVESLW